MALKCKVQLRQEEIHHAFEGIEAEGSGDRRTEIRVCVDIIENKVLFRGLEILDTAHVHATGIDELPASLDRSCWNLRVRMKFDWGDWSCPRDGAVRIAVFRVAHLGRAQIELTMRDHSHGVEQFTAEEFHAHNTALGINWDVFLKEQQIVRKPNVRVLADEALELVSGIEKIHAGAASTLFRFEESRPAIPPTPHAPDRYR